MDARPESKPTSFLCFICVFYAIPEFEELDNDLCLLASVDPSTVVRVSGRLPPRDKLCHNRTESSPATYMEQNRRMDL